jgi:hypothetical protein
MGLPGEPDLALLRKAHFLSLVNTTPRTMLRRFATMGALAVAVGCDSSTDPTVDEVAGSYSATTLVTTTNNVPKDQLARGATMNLVLTADGSVTGHLHIPADGTLPVLDADMAGSWALDRHIVTFDQSADTFVRDLPFLFVNNTLNTDRFVGDTRITVMLTR